MNLKKTEIDVVAVPRLSSPEKQSTKFLLCFEEKNNVLRVKTSLKGEKEVGDLVTIDRGLDFSVKEFKK